MGEQCSGRFTESQQKYQGIPNLIYMQLDPWLALSMAPAVDRGWEQIHAVIGVISVCIRRDRVGCAVEDAGSAVTAAKKVQ